MLTLSTLFADGAVLQRNHAIPVWGVSDPCSGVTVELAGFAANAATSDRGDFVAWLPPMVAGGPFTLTVRNLDGETLSRNDILIGEVWLASGQSNMEFRMEESPDQLAEFFAQRRDFGQLRMFTVERFASSARRSEPTGCWKSAADAAHAGLFSAVALWFAAKLQEELRVPVGILACSWGGTVIEAWTSAQTLARNPELTAFCEAFRTQTAQFDSEKFNLPVGEDPMIAKFGIFDTGNTGEARGWAEPDFDDSAWKPCQVPGSWIVQKIAGSGAVWHRLVIDVPADWAGRELILNLGGMDKHDVSYFNGVQVGATGSGHESACWNAPRHYRVPGELVRAGRAVIAVRGYSFIFDGGFNGMPAMYSLHPAGAAGEAISLAGVWRAGVEIDHGPVSFNPMRSPGPLNPNSPSILFDGMLASLIPYAIRGAIWYQGCSNADPNGAIRESYERKMCDLITDWRFHWGQGDFPFYYVQLANYRESSPYRETDNWPRLRDEQRRAAEVTRNSAIITAIDLGESGDIHPRDKRSVGFRLAEQALADTYGLPSRRLSPMPQSATVEGNRLRVTFRRAGSGLAWNGAKTGFYLSGGDGKFHAAELCEIEGNSVLLGSSLVSCPVRVRYAWSDNPPSALRNSDDMPAPGFELAAE